MQRIAAGAGIVDADDAARLDRIGGDAIDDEALLDNVGGRGKCCVGLRPVAGLIEVGFVARAVGIKLRRIFLRGLARRYHGGQRCVVDDDLLGCIAGAIERVGDDDRDGMTDMIHAAGGDGRARRQIHRAAVALLVRRHRGQGAERVGLIILADEYGADTRHPRCRAGVDTANVGVGMGRADDGGIKLVGNIEVVEVAALSAQQARILAPQYRLPDCKFAHHRTPKPRLASSTSPVPYERPAKDRRHSPDVKPSVRR